MRLKNPKRMTVRTPRMRKVVMKPFKKLTMRNLHGIGMTGPIQSKGALRPRGAVQSRGSVKALGSRKPIMSK